MLPPRLQPASGIWRLAKVARRLVELGDIERLELIEYARVGRAVDQLAPRAVRRRAQRRSGGGTALCGSSSRGCGAGRWRVQRFESGGSGGVSRAHRAFPPHTVASIRQSRQRRSTQELGSVGLSVSRILALSCLRTLQITLGDVIGAPVLLAPVMLLVFPTNPLEERREVHLAERERVGDLVSEISAPVHFGEQEEILEHREHGEEPRPSLLVEGRLGEAAVATGRSRNRRRRRHCSRRGH